MKEITDINVISQKIQNFLDFLIQETYYFLHYFAYDVAFREHVSLFYVNLNIFKSEHRCKLYFGALLFC